MQNKSLRYYIIITFVISYSIAFTYHLTGLGWNTKYAYIAALLYMFIPALSTIFVKKFIERQNIFDKKISEYFKLNKWFMAALLVPIFISILSFGYALLYKSVNLSLDLSGMYQRLQNMIDKEQILKLKEFHKNAPIHPFFIAIIQGIIAGITINGIVALGEEAGWRGFMFKKLKYLGFWRISLITGLIWGIWHAPLIAMGHNYPEHPIIGIFLMTLFCLFYTPLFTYVRIKTGSVIAAAVMHGTLNGTTGVALMLLKGGSDITVGITGLSGLAAIVSVNIIMIIYDKYFAQEKII